MTQALFTVNGMTCSSCEGSVSESVLKIPGVISVKASREKNNLMVEASRSVSTEEIAGALKAYPKYKVSDFSKKKTFFETYKPLVILFSFIILLSVANQIRRGSPDLRLLMNHLMAGFFIGLSFFKFLDLKAFSESFSGYDPIAKRFSDYGKAYPFLELTLGVAFLMGVFLTIANILTIVVLSVTTLGIIQRLRKKTMIQCACLGTTFNFPLSYVSVSENLVMIGMALLGSFSPMN